MKNTDEMIKEGGLWGGLCDGVRCGKKEKAADIIVFGIAFDGNVSYRDGAKVVDLGDIRSEKIEDDSLKLTYKHF